MELKFILVDDNKTKTNEWFSFHLTPDQFSKFLLRTNGGSITFPEIIYNAQNMLFVEGVDWSKCKEIRIDSEYSGLDLVFPVKKIDLAILNSRSSEILGRSASLLEIQNLLERGIELLVNA